MRVTEKFDLIDKVARELQSRFTYAEIDAFLREFGVKPPTNNITNSKWVYSKSALHEATQETIVRISQELDIISAASGIALPPPKNWEGVKQFRLFISHVSAEKKKATRMKECLSSYGIQAFVAHEDIHPSLEWQIEIERGLHNMDALLAIHTVGFEKSFWCQQEIGFALGRNIKIVSLEFGELPTGFISKFQAIKRSNRTAEEIAVLIDFALTEDSRTKDRLSEAKIAFRAENPSDYDQEDNDVLF